jgi:hypothetical protein
MLDYREHFFELTSGTDLASRVESALGADPATTRAALDGWIGRKSEIEAGSIHVVGIDPEGFLELSFRETQWLACRMETGSAGHTYRIRYRIDGGRLILSTLPRDAFEDRVDDL